MHTLGRNPTKSSLMFINLYFEKGRKKKTMTKKSKNGGGALHLEEIELGFLEVGCV